MDRTYQELTQNDRRIVDLNINRKTGVAYTPSGASFEVVGHEKQNSVVPLTPATVLYNRVSAFITETVTASAGDYDIKWEIRKETAKGIPTIKNYHCTRLLVIEC